MAVESLAPIQELPQPHATGFADLPPKIADCIKSHTFVSGSENPTVTVYDFESRGDAVYGIFSGDLDGESEITVLDISEDGQEEGVGTVSRDMSLPESVSQRLPYVSWIETHEGYERQGLAERRLRIMNALSEEIYGTPIHSELEDFTSEDGDKLVRSLAARGIAEAFQDGDEQRWRPAS